MKSKYLSIIATFALALFAGQSAGAQSKEFKLGQWTEIHNGIIKELSRSYVDSLPVDKMMREGVNAMLEQLDPYTVYIPEEENEDLQMMLSKTYGGIGAIIHKKKEGNVIINEPYFGSPAQKYGLQCGDEILEIDGVPTIGLETKESSDRMKGKPGTTVVFKVKKVRSGEIIDIPVVRKRIHFPDIEYAGMIDDTTGYILQSGFTENVANDLRNRFAELKSQGMKRLVLDLRGNSGGLMSEAIGIVSTFVPKGSLVVTSKGNTAESTKEYHTSMEPLDTEMPIIVMIDEAASEILLTASSVMAMEFERIPIIALKPASSTFASMPMTLVRIIFLSRDNSFLELLLSAIISPHYLFKSKHPVVHQIIGLCVGVVRIGMMTVEKLDDMKTAAVDIKVDISFFEIRSDSFPNPDLRIHTLNLAPRGVADTLAVSTRRYKEQLQIAFIAFNTDNRTSGCFSVTNNTVCLAVDDRFLDRSAGNDLSVLLKVFVAQPKLLCRSVSERLLIVENELIFILSPQRL